MKAQSLRLLLAVVLIYIWFKLVNVSELVNLLGQINIAWFIPVVLILIINLFLSIFRLQLLLKPRFNVSYFYLLKLNVVGSVASIVAPANAGGFLRAFLLKGKVKSSYSSVFGFILADFIVTVITVVVFGIAGFAYFTITKSISAPTGLVAIALVLVISGFVLLLKPKWGNLAGDFAISKLIPEKFSRRFKKMNQDYWKAYMSLSGNLPKLALIMSISVFMYILSGASIYFLFRSFGVYPSLISAVFANSIFSLINIVPTSPAKVGQYELVGLLVFTNLLNLETNLVAAATLLSHVIGLTFALLIFMLVMNVFGKKDFIAELR